MAGSIARGFGRGLGVALIAWGVQIAVVVAALLAVPIAAPVVSFPYLPGIFLIGWLRPAPDPFFGEGFFWIISVAIAGALLMSAVYAAAIGLAFGLYSGRREEER